MFQNFPVVIMDNGTGLTKIGLSGNNVPSYVFPTVITSSQMPGTGSGRSVSISKSSFLGSSLSIGSSLNKRGAEDLDFYIGYEALEQANGLGYSLNYPIRHGIIESWDYMERFWQQSIFKYLKCDPEDHYFLLTEPPLNPPENREHTAEIMFESFNCGGLYIAVQAVLALAASWTSSKVQDRSLTGTVIDSGDGVTHVTPVADGYVIGSALKHIPIAGRDITYFVQSLLRDRNELDSSLKTAEKIKEEYSYVCPDIIKEFSKYDREPERFQKYYVESSSDKKIVVDVGYERFLGPEIFFHPEIASSDFLTPLPEVVDSVIQASPIDVRRGLYKNIVLSGGSTMFKDFGKRMQRDIRQIVEKRIRKGEKLSGVKSGGLEVNVISHKKQRNAVFVGASLISQAPEFLSYCCTKKDYEEYGPGIVRRFAIFGSFL
ncbi:hypothetical protein T552_01469 [Pneumocystis carinii B80]|uniref:Actin-related protein 3 n=1 Tax=Pneumocystis carinii (strain B80) TaxID=1408658 RepID=A0A0W4ZKG5_PNEC8|nr:hypothetical protein T552_01469 [Pneumocystis carinii B80]KTW28840.1 hypothetical protein T552_01469 [Pneumocystis carinii B80]